MREQVQPLQWRLTRRAVIVKARAGATADDGSHAAELGLFGMQHVVLVNYHPRKPRGAQRDVEILGQIRENGAKPVL